MRTTPARNAEGRFVGFRTVLEYVPRIDARDVGRALQDPRRCAYRLVWRPADSLPARHGGKPSEEQRGLLEPRGEAVHVTLAEGRETVVQVTRRRPCRSGWILVFHCPRCDRRTRHLYAVRGSLRCRWCAGLRYRSEGFFRARLQRRLWKLVGPRFTLTDAPWTARVHPEVSC